MKIISFGNKCSLQRYFGFVQMHLNGSLRINLIPVSENPVFDFFLRYPSEYRLILNRFLRSLTFGVWQLGQVTGTYFRSCTNPNLLHFVLSYFSKSQINRFGGLANINMLMDKALTALFAIAIVINCFPFIN